MVWRRLGFRTQFQVFCHDGFFNRKRDLLENIRIDFWSCRFKRDLDSFPNELSTIEDQQRMRLSQSQR
jgi:hypothetical protein